MKWTALNVVQLVLMALIVVCPSIGADWPVDAAAMQVTAAIAASSLAAVNLYAPPLVPASILTPVGLQGVHVIQGIIGTAVTTVAAMGAANPHWGAAVRIVSDVGGILMGVLGLFSPKALNGPIMAMRLRRLAKDRSPTETTHG